MKKSHPDMAVRTRQDVKWERLVKAGPKRWRTLNKFGYVVIGFVTIPLGIYEFILGARVFTSGDVGRGLTLDPHGLPLSSSDMVVRGCVRIFAGLVLIWIGFRTDWKKRGRNDKPSS